MEVTKLVGWVERSDTHHVMGGVANGHRTCSKVMGFASAQPILRADRAFPPDVVVLPHRLTYIAIPDRAEPVIGRPFTTRWS
jgi:hypothetical protein